MWRILCNSDHRDYSNNQTTILAVMVVKKSGGLDLCFQANSCMWGVCKGCTITVNAVVCLAQLVNCSRHHTNRNTGKVQKGLSASGWMHGGDITRPCSVNRIDSLPVDQNYSKDGSSNTGSTDNG